MIILGIDPGSRQTGYGLIDNRRERMIYLASGHIRVQGERFPERLGDIFERLCAIIAEHRPAQMSIESVFMHRNAGSALKLGQARGAAICAGHQAGLKVYEYAPREVKQALVGRGGAEKEQVRHMVMRLLGLKAEPQIDESDALALAICHAQHQMMENRTGLPASAFKTRRTRRR